MADLICAACGVTFTPPTARKSSKSCSKCRGQRYRDQTKVSIESKARSMVRNAGRRAAAKGLPCDIDPLWVVTQWYKQGGRCYFSGRPMVTTSGQRLASLDRINSAKGYTTKNTVLVAVIVNTMKSNLKVEEFLDWCSAVSESQSKKESSQGAAGYRSPARASR